MDNTTNRVIIYFVNGRKITVDPDNVTIADDVRDRLLDLKELMDLNENEIVINWENVCMMRKAKPEEEE